MGNKENSEIKKEIFVSYKNISVIIIIISVFIFISFLIAINLPYSFNLNKKVVYITYGSNLKQISKNLSDNKVIRNKFLFEFYVLFTGSYKKIKAGEYEFFNYDSIRTVTLKMVKGEVLKHKIVIPEGSDINDISVILSAAKLINKDRFLQLVSDKNFLNKLGVKYNSLEGLLFPDTYYFVIGESEEKIIMTMYERFKNMVKIDLEKYYNIYNYNIKGYNIIKLASIIEKESKADEERPIIASVFYNRLKSKEPYQRRLESCATVRYALNKKEGALTNKDLRFNSPYNTYIIIGFPPTPICSPGIKSINAALNPSQTDYFYFVVKENGTHSFSSDLESHLKYKKMNRMKK